VVAIVKVNDDDSAVGPHNLFIEDCEQQKQMIARALVVSAPVHKPAPGTITADFEPCCGHQGETKCIKFTGEGLAGSGVCFGRGKNILTKATSYSDDGTNMSVEIAIRRRARIGKYDVMLFTADGGCVMLDEKFEVLAEV